MNRWTKEEEQRLVSEYNRFTNDELANRFNRTFLGIYKKARKLGLYRADDITFRNRSEVRKGEKSSSWKGGRKVTPKGYVQVFAPEHHRADVAGYVMEHILVFEEATGITIPIGCDIHHINGNKQDNSINNLCLLTHAAHTTLHNKGGKKHE